METFWSPESIKAYKVFSTLTGDLDPTGIGQYANLKYKVGESYTAECVDEWCSSIIMQEKYMLKVSGQTVPPAMINETPPHLSTYMFPDIYVGSCGFHAYKDLERAVQMSGPTISPIYIIHEVELSGKIIEHEHGYRAEKITIGKKVKWRERRKAWRKSANLRES